MTWKEVFNMLLATGGLTALLTFIGKVFGWRIYRTKNVADVNKVKSATAVDLADAENKRIDDEVKISKAALEWTVQLAGQLDKANMINEKRQSEIETYRIAMAKMREDFDSRMDEMERLLEESKAECAREREKYKQEKKRNDELLSKLNAYLNGDR